MPSHRQSGFTAIELMVTVAIVAILAALALPSFQASLRSNRVATTTNEVLASLALARTEAIRGLGPAGVCPSADGNDCATTTDWAGGWVVWRENRLSGGVIERAVVRYVQPKQRTTVTGPDAGIDFTVQGRAQNGAEQIGVSPVDAADPARCVMVNAAGQARTAQGACP